MLYVSFKITAAESHPRAENPVVICSFRLGVSALTVIPQWLFLTSGRRGDNTSCSDTLRLVPLVVSIWYSKLRSFLALLPPSPQPKLIKAGKWWFWEQRRNQHHYQGKLTRGKRQGRASIVRDDLPVIPFISGLLPKGDAHNLGGSFHIHPGIQDTSSVEASYSRNSSLWQVSAKNNYHTPCTSIL